jgi:hypothetical protein
MARLVLRSCFGSIDILIDMKNGVPTNQRLMNVELLDAGLSDDTQAMQIHVCDLTRIDSVNGVMTHFDSFFDE